MAGGGGRRPQSRRLVFEVRIVRRPSVSGRLPLAKRGTMKIVMGVCRRDAETPWTPGGSQQDHADHNTCVLTTRTLQGLGPCRGPQRQQTPCCRVRPGAPRRSGGCALGSRGQRIAGVARRPVVVVSISSGRRAGHVPSYEASHHGSAGSRMLRRSASSTCPSLRRSALNVDALEPFRGERNRQFTGDEVFFYDHLCRASLPREHIDAAVTSMKSVRGLVGACRVDQGPGGCRDSVPRRDEKNKHSRKGKLAGLLVVDRRHAERSSAYHAVAPSPQARLKLDGGVRAFQAGVFRRRPTYPVAPPDESRSGRFRGCLKSFPGQQMPSAVPLRFCPEFHPARGQVLARVLGRSLFGDWLAAALQ